MLTYLKEAGIKFIKSYNKLQMFEIIKTVFNNFKNWISTKKTIQNNDTSTKKEISAYNKKKILKYAKKYKIKNYKTKTYKQIVKDLSKVLIIKKKLLKLQALM
jgi:hypothetical protein